MSLVELLEGNDERNTSLKDGNEEEIEKIHQVLTSIACEVQKFHDDTFDSETYAVSPIPGYKEKQNVFSELLKCKTKIKSKRDRINRLRNHLKTACSVAKIVASARENESETLKKSLESAKGEYAILLEKHQNNTRIINKLSKENEGLLIKYDNIANFIRLGYEELQKIRKEPLTETTALEQLRKLIVCCGQYYADYSNEHDECSRIKHRNNYLTSKILILENNIQALSQQLKALQYRNFRLQKENERCTKSNRNFNVAYSEVTVTKSSTTKESSSDGDDDDNENPISIDNAKQYKLNYDYENDFDLSPHLTKVKKLLHYQDELLKDLKNLSEEFKSNKSVD